MTIAEIKAAINAKEGITLPTLAMTRQFAEDKVTPTEWLSFWHDESRVRVTMHQDIKESLVKEVGKADLSFKREEIPAGKTKTGEARAAYVRYVIITPKHVEACF